MKGGLVFGGRPATTSLLAGVNQRGFQKRATSAPSIAPKRLSTSSPGAIRWFAQSIVRRRRASSVRLERKPHVAVSVCFSTWKLGGTSQHGDLNLDNS